MTERTADPKFSRTGLATVSTLLAAGLLHLVWATGSTFPFRSRAALNDAVIGRQVTPGPRECVGVAVLLSAAAGAVACADRRQGPGSRIAASGVCVVLATRAAFGFAGRTSMLVPGSESTRFRRMDRSVYAPICALLAAGAGRAAR
ncbi:DUF3995 domain-containing protein [Ilumatobacter sp.]|uniref:DUF3995 domain-containing protein n=1 Tax=Ilumatobacter sp. TaxID=1967498 RepID=UPI003C5B2215